MMRAVFTPELSAHLIMDPTSNPRVMPGWKITPFLPIFLLPMDYHSSSSSAFSDSSGSSFDSAISSNSSFLLDFFSLGCVVLFSMTTEATVLDIFLVSMKTTRSPTFTSMQEGQCTLFLELRRSNRLYLLTLNKKSRRTVTVFCRFVLV